MTADRKQKLLKDLSPYITSPDDVLGAEDLEGYFTRNGHVERAHVKLWLSSAGQLDERINGAIWDRSRLLKSQIDAAISRYVPSDAYPDAKTRLLQEKVLVISGPPGIGKSTLARLLVADAVTEGMTPVEISSDAEEAFAVVNDRERQVFYYDDFLGSTFLQDRLAKNEDKRLSAFMNRIVASDKHLFVLTTREHILQQATSWYEELARQGIHLSRYLLEVSSYSRIDRARILYNHIWNSSQVTLAARTQLATDRAYLRIVDHTNYNPRLIEYVTGLASRQLGDTELRDYVGFVVDILDHLDQVWRFAFDRQLDESCRRLLLIVATMPSQVTESDLRHAFLTDGESRGKPETHQSFRQALRILEDSFTRSHEESNETFIVLANPSIEDFAASWLSENFDHALSLIDGVAFFEQLPWLWERVVHPGLTPSSPDAVDRISGAMRRSWRSGNPEWHDVYVNNGEHPVKWRKGDATAERLSFAYRVIESHHAKADSSAWFAEALTVASASWAARISSAGPPVQLIEQLKQAGYDVPISVVTSVRDGLRLSNHSYAYEQLQFLRIVAPEGFPPDMVDWIQTECRAWLLEELNQPEYFRDVDELETCLTAAEEWGVEAPEEMVSRVRETIDHLPVADALDDDPDDAKEFRPSATDPVTERRALESIFAHLTGS
ncbi:hypothetical protein [Leifsonia sp. Le1]|uniref:ATP-binding protein n=1 Tax=Leifsonia sp. Le1 TaxID=3404918 RepID=UPI003EBE14FF